MGEEAADFEILHAAHLAAVDALDMEAAALAVTLGPSPPQSQRSFDELEELSAELSAFDASADEGRTLQGAPSSSSSCPGKTDGDLPVNCHDL